MISVEEARTRVLEKLQGTRAETISLAQGFGRVLAEPVRARLNQPPADVSSMDGYALRAVDGVAGARLKLIGAAPAGHPFGGAVGPGEAVRLFTGGFVPAGADTVLIQENATAEQGFVTLNHACEPGRHIRRQGQDFTVGETLIPAGKRLSARDIGLAASSNAPWLRVHRKPRIAILATGDEISLPGEAIGPGGIVSSNTHALAAFVLACGAEPLVLPIAGDDRDAIAAGADAARGTDMMLTTGGVSVGAHDLVQAGLETRGFVLDFWKIAMRPGKPLMFGWLGGLPILGLPGNPVSALVGAVLFLRPAIERMSGLACAAPMTELVRLGGSLRQNDVREDYMRATLTRDGADWVAIPHPAQDSAMMKNLALAEALIRRPPHQAALSAGDVVEIIRLGDL